MRIAFIAWISALTLLGCGYAGIGGYDQRGGSAIAQKLGGASPIVLNADYNPGDYMDPATIDVILRSGVEAPEARAFICGIAIPAMAAGDPPEGLVIDAWDSTSTRILASSVDACFLQSQKPPG